MSTEQSERVWPVVKGPARVWKTLQDFVQTLQDFQRLCQVQKGPARVLRLCRIFKDSGGLSGILWMFWVVYSLEWRETFSCLSPPLSSSSVLALSTCCVCCKLISTPSRFPVKSPLKPPLGQLSKHHLVANICQQMRQLSHNYFVSTL